MLASARVPRFSRTLPTGNNVSAQKHVLVRSRLPYNGATDPKPNQVAACPISLSWTTTTICSPC